MSREKDYASAHNLANQNKQKYDQEQADRHQVALGVKYGFVKPEHADKTPQELLAIKYGFDKPEIEETKDTTLAQRYQKSKDKNPDKLVTSVGNPSTSVGEGLLLNYSKDVAWIQEKLLNLGILSDASYAAEKATGDDYIGSDAIPQTIKAIITYQKEVLGYGSTDGQVTAGGKMETSIGLANLDTVNKKREEYKKGLEAKEKAEREEEFILKIKNTPSTNEAVGDFFNNASLVSVPYLVHDLAPYMNHNPEFFKAVLNHAKFTDTNAYDVVNHLNDAQLNGFSNDIKSQLKSKLTNGLGFTLNAEYQEQVGRIEGKKDGKVSKVETEIKPDKSKLGDFMKKNRLSPKEIKEAREEIKTLPESERAVYYRKLQSKVNYNNQRDSKAKYNGERIEKSGGGMCNLTSLAMALVSLGVSPKGDEQFFEDELEVYSQDYNLKTNKHSLQEEARESAGVRMGMVKEKYGIESKFISLKDKYKSKSWWLDIKKNYFDKGWSGILSRKGHIVRLEAIEEKGLRVDDPYGKQKFIKTKKDRYKRTPDKYNSKKDDASEYAGEDNLWEWKVVEKAFALKYLELYKGL